MHINNFQVEMTLLGGYLVRQCFTRYVAIVNTLKIFNVSLGMLSK